MKKTQRLFSYTLGLGFLLPLFVFIGFIIHEVYYGEPTDDFSAALAEALMREDEDDEQPQDDLYWREYYPVTVPMSIGGVDLQASVAKTWPDRIKGLSDTPYLPEGVAKFFVFDSSGYHSIWMKDMQYAIDILWLNEEGDVVYIVENATPESFPETYIPDVPARYVVEVASGFVAENKIAVGAGSELPEY